MTFDWTRLLGRSKEEEADALTTGNDGSIDIGGNTKGDLDGNRNNGNNDTFLSKFNPNTTNMITGSNSNDELINTVLDDHIDG